MNSLAEWLLHLERLHPKGQAGIELGLERVLRVKRVLQQTSTCPVLIVGGTNGKGSVCAYLEAVYSFAGYRVGCYTSPHLLEYNERIRVDRRSIDDDSLCRAFARVEAAREAAGNTALTYFEFGTLAAWEVFTAARVDLIILEVGLGGRLDAVNVYESDCAVVTGIALDHTDWLGPDRESIGFEKAGIFRHGRPAVCADPEPPDSLIRHAQDLGSDLRLLGRDFGYFGDRSQWTFWCRENGTDGMPLIQRRGGLANPGLRGSCQLRNASAVLTVVRILDSRLHVPMQAVRRGLLEVELPGRFQVLPGRPARVLDVAHNPQAVAGLAENLGEMGFYGKTLAIVGMLADKDISGSLAQLRGKVDHWLPVSLEVPRGASAERLAQILEEARVGGEVDCFPSVREAYAFAVKQAGENDRILIFGSFHTVADAIRAMKLDSAGKGKADESGQSGL